MGQGGLRLGRILGIPVSADLGVLLIGGFLTWSLATIVLPRGEPGLTGGAYWSVAAIGALLFLGSLLAHEMGHSVVARRNGVEVEGVTLWLFGGVARLKNEAPNPGAEFRIAAAGPAVSIVLGVGFIAAAIGLGAVGVPDLYRVLLSWLGIINVVLGVFNLLPGAPLDGGRILGSIIWRIRGDRVRAKVAAARVGRFVGLTLIGLGLAEILFIGTFSGLWTAFIGWFLMNAARMEQGHYRSEQALGDLPVRAAMVADPEVVRTWTTVAELVEGPLRSTTQSAVPVLDFGGHLAGAVTLAQVRSVPAQTWTTTEVAQVMVPVGALTTATAEEPLTGLLERLDPRSGGLAVVVREGRPVGIVGPTEVQRAVELGRLRPRGSPDAAGSSGEPDAAGAAGRTLPPPPPAVVPHQEWEPPVTSSR
jgi:Zn-dependent protease